MIGNSRRCALVLAIGTWAAMSGLAVAAEPVEKPKLVISDAAQTIQFLPATVAQRLGYFKDEGLDVDLVVFAGGAKALEALIGGSADITSGAFQQAILMAAKDQQLTVFAGQSFSSTSLIVGKPHAATFKSVKDMKGWKIGVTAPGSGTHMFLGKILNDNGLSLSDVSVIGVGSGPSAVAALERNLVDAILNADPVTTTLQNEGHLVPPEYDTRTPAGCISVFGAVTPEASFYAKADFVKKYPRTVQAVTNAIVRADKWLHSATPEQVADALPPEVVGSDRKLFIDSFKNSLGTISQDGRISREGIEALEKTTANFLPDIAAAVKDGRIRSQTLYDPRFVEAANASGK
jgi:NitT/TauT family transport system substrate-binding protein